MTSSRRAPITLPDCLLLAGGKWTEGESRGTVLDKYCLEPSTRYHVPSRAQIAQAVAESHAAFRASTLTPHERGAILERTAAELEKRFDQLSRALCAEAGFTPSDAAGEIRRCLVTFRLSAEEARSFCGEMVPIGGAPGQGARMGFTMRVPLGVVCAITPFNAPLNTVAHKVGPALAAGNSVVLKPSSNTPSAANLMGESLLAAGLPAGLLTILHGGAKVAQALLEEQAVRFYAFTGSTEVGRAIQQAAGLRRTQMELGSIAFTIVCDDANLDAALPKLINAGYRKAGQVCTSVQVVLVHSSIRETVESRLAEMVGALACGDPADAKTFVGPIISEPEAVRIETWIDEAIARGARRLAGGPRDGSVVAPTLLTGIDDTMSVACSEIFGPVMSIVPFDTIGEAIARINSTPYGLAAGIFTNRLDEAFRAAREIEAGGVHINETSSSRVDVMPYGGSKESGFGREGPHYAVREMSEERMVTLLV